MEKRRCGNCKSWKDGKRGGFTKKSAKNKDVVTKKKGGGKKVRKGDGAAPSKHPPENAVGEQDPPTPLKTNVSDAARATGAGGSMRPHLELARLEWARS